MQKPQEQRRSNAAGEIAVWSAERWSGRQNQAMYLWATKPDSGCIGLLERGIGDCFDRARIAQHRVVHQLDRPADGC
ncbi:MAG: hypothetical protein HOO98_18240 [Nitrospira sp.]|nr:hypothetical protein [Nitrospira sp.]